MQSSLLGVNSCLIPAELFEVHLRSYTDNVNFRMQSSLTLIYTSTMTRITSIGMGRKTFVPSAAEEAQKPTTEPAAAGPSTEKKDKKRPRDDMKGGNEKKGWKRDPEIASQYLLILMREALIVRGNEG
jgi:hypothetical protein